MVLTTSVMILKQPGRCRASLALQWGEWLKILSHCSCLVTLFILMLYSLSHLQSLIGSAESCCISDCVLFCTAFSSAEEGQKLVCTTEFIDAAGFGSLVSRKVPNEQERIILNGFNFCVYFCLQTGAVYVERKCSCSYTWIWGNYSGRWALQENNPVKGRVCTAGAKVSVQVLVQAGVR